MNIIACPDPLLLHGNPALQRQPCSWPQGWTKAGVQPCRRAEASGAERPGRVVRDRDRTTCRSQSADCL